MVKPEYDYFIVTSNYTPAQIYGMRSMNETEEEYEAKQTAVAAITRRFKIIHVQDRGDVEHWMNISPDTFPVGR